jgi:hypothetical protein
MQQCFWLWFLCFCLVLCQKNWGTKIIEAEPEASLRSVAWLEPVCDDMRGILKRILVFLFHSRGNVRLSPPFYRCFFCFVFEMTGFGG